MRFSSISLSHDTGGVSTGITMPTLVLPLGSTANAGPYLLKSVKGLEPPPIDVIVSEGLNSENTLQGTSPNNREVIMTVGYKPNYGAGQTIGDLRSQLYPWLTPKFGLPIKMSILDSNGSQLAYVLCRIKRFETDIFSKDPQVVITFTCIGSYLSAADYVYPGLGSLSKTSYILTNPGDAPSGFKLVIVMTGSNGQFNLYNRFNARMQFNYSFVSGDIITVSSVAGNRYANVNRSSVITNLLPYQISGFTWIDLFGGQNPFTFGHSSYNFTSLTIYPKYWGV